MGKHERQLIEEAEKIIEKILKSVPLTNDDKNNHWFSHALKIARQINKDFSKISFAQYLGNQ